MCLRTPAGSIDSARVPSKMRAPVRFGGRRQPERIIERMDMKGGREMDGVEIVAAPEHLAHALGRPAFDLTAQVLAYQSRCPR